MYRVTVGEREFTCEEEDMILEAARRHLVKIPYGCANGGCGMCKIKLVSGTCRMKLYSKGALNDDERKAGYILTCKAIPLSDITLQLLEME